MKKANIFVTLNKGKYHIKVEGRATFECGPHLRNIVKDIDPGALKSVSIDLSSCKGMDSTFMGILAMTALKARENKARVEIINAGESNKKLLNGLGLEKLFTYRDNVEYDTGSAQRLNKIQQIPVNKTETIETVLDAHETLMDTDEENVGKFKDVVDFAKKDLEKEKQAE